jgi:hypothetical protein
MHSFGNTARCVELDTGVEGERIWMMCTCGTTIERWLDQSLTLSVLRHYDGPGFVGVWQAGQRRPHEASHAVARFAEVNIEELRPSNNEATPGLVPTPRAGRARALPRGEGACTSETSATGRMRPPKTLARR